VLTVDVDGAATELVGLGLSATRSVAKREKPSLAANATAGASSPL
jgi:hypothetical protein